MPDTEQIMTAAGISYRQAHYWTHSGWLRADNPAPGSGRDRVYPDEELEVASLIKRLVDAGLVIQQAAKVARAAVSSGPDARSSWRLAPGIAITVEPGTALARGNHDD